MKNIQVLLVAIFLMVCSALATVVYYRSYHILQVEEIKMNVTVAKRVGFVVDADALKFGTTYPGGQSRRIVTIDNNYRIPIKVEIRALGGLGPRLEVSQNNFVLKPTEERNVTFTIHAPEDVPLNTTLNGTVQIVFKRSLFG